VTKSRNVKAARHTWTADELAVIRAQYASKITSEIAAQLGLPVHLVYSKANRMGLTKGADFLATSKSGRILKGGKLGQANQFVPGQKPWNDGLKGFQAGGRSVETRFKPGNSPHTTLPVGAYRIVTHCKGSKHLEQKTSEAKGGNHMRWTPVSRLVWEKANGPVPRGHVVVFKPGQSTLVLEQITIDRLECITRRELARRNHPNSSNPAFARLIQLKGAITRQVNRIQKESLAP